MTPFRNNLSQFDRNFCRSGFATLDVIAVARSFQFQASLGRPAPSLPCANGWFHSQTLCGYGCRKITASVTKRSCPQGVLLKALPSPSVQQIFHLQFSIEQNHETLPFAGSPHR